jgi:hypothetical protein
MLFLSATVYLVLFHLELHWVFCGVGKSDLRRYRRLFLDNVMPVSASCLCVVFE